MTAHISVVMKRAAQLEQSRRKPPKNLAPVQPLPEKPMPPARPSRNPMFDGLCPLCGCRTVELYCYAHRWAM